MVESGQPSFGGRKSGLRGGVFFFGGGKSVRLHCELNFFFQKIKWVCFFFWDLNYSLGYIIFFKICFVTTGLTGLRCVLFFFLNLQFPAKNFSLRRCHALQVIDFRKQHPRAARRATLRRMGGARGGSNDRKSQTRSTRGGWMFWGAVKDLAKMVLPATFHVSWYIYVPSSEVGRQDITSYRG